MAYENAQYVRDIDTDEIKSIKVDIDGTTWWVPIANDNTTYQDMMSKVDAGELTIADA